MEQVYFLRLKNINKTFPGVKALNNVQLSVKAGEVHALVGENGAGKSTLIKIMSGVYKPDEGSSMEINGENVRLNDINESIRRGISVIYQDLCLFPNLTVAENMCIGKDISKSQHINWKEYERLSQKTLDRMQLDIPVKEKLMNLSLAKQQLVAIARAIAFDAKLIVMDEPTASLSKTEVETLFEIITRLKSEGISILFISHKLDEVFTIADTITVLRDGNYVDSKSISEVTEQDIIRMMVGRNIEYVKLNKNSHAKEKVAFEVQNISKRGHYKDISFLVKEGEILGITGLVGAGRSEVLRTIFGVISPDSGKMFLYGKEIKLKGTEDAKHQGIAYAPEDRHAEGLIMSFDIYNNIGIVNYEKCLNKIGFIDNAKMKALTDRVVEQMDVRPKKPERKAGEFSGGNQQKVVIGKGIVQSPKLLVVDEPTYGVDIGSKIEIHKLLRKLAEDGMAIIVVSSELQEILTLADRILVMRKGRLVAEMNANLANQEMIMGYALPRGNKEALT